jgi:hypothetical protein
VVFEIDSQDYSPEHFDKYNVSDKKEQTEAARIIKYSKIVKPDVLRAVADVYDRYQFDFGNVYGNPQVIQEVTNIFVKTGVIQKMAAPGFFDGNKPSDKGKAFVKEYTLGAVLKESIVKALYSEGMGDIKKTVIDAAPLLLANWAKGSYAVVDELNKAIEYAVAYTNDLINGTFSVPKLDKEEAKVMTAEQKLGHSLSAFTHWAQQGDLYETKDPVVLKLAGALVYSGPLFRDYLKRLNDVTNKAAKADRETQESGNTGLFGDTSPDRHSLLEKAVASWDRRYAVKRNILSSVLFEGGNMISSGIIDGLANATGLDIKSRIMKWTSAKPENRQAWQQAIRLFRENFGHGPKTERDATLLMKTAKKMAESGQMFSGDQFEQFAKQEMTGQGGQPGSQNQSGYSQEQGSQQGSQGQGSASSPADDPVKLFTALKKLYKSGAVSKDQLVKAFQHVVSSLQMPVMSILRNTDKYTASPAGKDMSPALQDKWDQVKTFLSRLRANGVRARDSVIDSLQRAFHSWMTPQLAEEAYQQFTVFAGLSRRFQPLTSSQRKALCSRYGVGSRVVYRPLPLASWAPDFLVSAQRRFSGQAGKILSIRSEVYNVEMPDGEVVSAAEPELELIESSRPVSNDPMRETVRQFLSNISSLTSVPNDQHGVVKEVLEPDHVVYMHTESLPNGKPYTIEFHMVPGEPAADVYVVRDFDNHPLDENGYTIEDMDDWNLSEVDYVDALFAEEMARTGVKEEPGKEDDTPSMDATGQYTFDKWFGDMGNVSAGLHRPSLMDLAICSGLYRAVASSGSYSPGGEGVSQVKQDFLNGFLDIDGAVDALVRFGIPQEEADGEVGMWNIEFDPPGSDYSGVIPSGVQAFLNRTLDVADKLTSKPLSVVDDVVEAPFRVADKVLEKSS